MNVSVVTSPVFLLWVPTIMTSWSGNHSLAVTAQKAFSASGAKSRISP
jgi:hypothetical protein